MKRLLALLLLVGTAFGESVTVDQTGQVQNTKTINFNTGKLTVAGVAVGGGGGGGSNVSSITLNTPALIYTNPITFTNTSGAWAGTLSPIAQSANTFFGNGTGSSATPTFMSASTARTALGGTTVGQNIFSLTNPSAITFLQINADNTVTAQSASAQRTALGLGTLATQSGTFSGTSSGTNTGDQTITLTGDVTGSGTGSFAATIANSAVTYAKMQNVSANSKLLGSSATGSGAPPSEITLGTNLSISGSTLNATGGGTPGGSNTQLQYNNSGAFGGISTFTTDGTSITGTLAPAANTAVAGLTLTDTTAATSGNQQYSPYIYLTGQGWKSNTTAASQSTTFRLGVTPVQGAVSPTAQFVIESSINGGAFGNAVKIDSSGTFQTTIQAAFGAQDSSGSTWAMNSNGATLGATKPYGWSSTGNISLAPDIALHRDAVGIAAVDSGTSAKYAQLKAGTVALQNLATPAASPSAAVVGTAGSTTISYSYTDCQADGSCTAASPVVTVTTANATLTSSNKITLTFPALGTNTTYRNVYRTATNGTSPTTTGKINSSTVTTTTFDDTGLAGDASTAPTANSTGVVSGIHRLKGFTVATLPGGTQGDMAFVTDATAPTYNGTLTGGGAVVVPVFYNGTAWTSH